jgi:HK97 family phage major capsid protein
MTASRPKFRKIDLELNGGGILFYATDDLLNDASLLKQEVNAAVSDELAFAMQDGIINGSGRWSTVGDLK